MKRTIIQTMTGAVLLCAVLSGCSKQGTAELPLGPAVRLNAGVVTGTAAPGSDDKAAMNAGSDLRSTEGAMSGTTADAGTTPRAAGHPGTSTRSAVNPGEIFTAAAAGWEASGTPDYNTPCAWQATFSAMAAGAAQPVQLLPQPYYNYDNAVKTYIKAWYPAGTVGSDGKVTFTDAADGNVDVMLTEAVAGNREDVGGKNLEFSHLLSQLRFRVKAASNLTVKPTLTSITVHGVQLPSGLDLTTDAATYHAASDFTLAGIEAGNITFTTTAQGVGTPLLLRPFDGKTFTVNIVTSKGIHRNVVAAIDGDERFIPGKAYTITLTYTGRDSQPLDAAVSVTAWEDVEGGDSNIPM